MSQQQTSATTVYQSYGTCYCL